MGQTRIKINTITGCILTALLFIQVPFRQNPKASVLTESAARRSDDSGDGASSKGVAEDLRSMIDSQPDSDRLIDVIVKTTARPNMGHYEIIRRHGGALKHRFANIDAVLAEIRIRDVERLASEDGIEFITPDRQVTCSLDATTTLIGADKLRQPVASSYGWEYPGVDGTGVGIAVIDSGISAPSNSDFQLKASTGSRVVCFQDFVGDSSGVIHTTPYDDYGHGTTVAGTAAGNGWGSRQVDSQGDLWYPGNYGYFTGIAPNANLIVIKALNYNGVGMVSTAIRAMDFCISNKSTYNIRVVNLSFGGAVMQSYKTDPLCQEAEECVANGIAVVCSAGNYGHNDVLTGYDASGKPIYQTIYGGIVSPSNDPKVITVGATKDPAQTLETWSGSWNGHTVVNYNPNPQPLRRSDLRVASFSSRGPTLVDGIIKPDVVAPGTKIIAAATRNTATLTDQILPNTVMPRSSNGGVAKMYCQLSGTSFSAPVISGITALMLQANPSLTPRTVRAVLMLTAQQLPSLASRDPIERLLTEGAGLVNAYAAVRLSQNIRPDAGSATGGQDLLKAGVTLTGLDQDLKLVLTDRYGNFLEYGVLNSGFLLSDGHLLSDGFLLCDGFLLGDAHLLADGFLLCDGYLLTSGSVWPSGLLLAESYARAYCLQAWGTQTVALQNGIQAGYQQPLSFYADGRVAQAGNMDGGVVFSPAALNIWGSSVIDPTTIPAAMAADSAAVMGSNDDVPVSGLRLLSFASQYYPKQN